MTEAAAAPAVRERPLMFKAEMVRAILAGTKTQTRRLVKPQPTPATWAQAGANLGGNVTQARLVVHPLFGIGLRRDDADHAGIGFPDPNIRCPYGEAGERLWVRETWAPAGVVGDETEYRADSPDPTVGPWKPSIHMPRRVARIVLELTDVRVERLQDISEADAKAEGIGQAAIDLATARGHHRPMASAYAELWDAINGVGASDANPWVWALTFRRLGA